MPSISVPAAIAIGAGVSAVGAVGGSLISGSAAKSAANTEAAAADQSAALQEQQYQTTRSDLLPYQGSGQDANNILQSSIFGGGDGAPNLLTANGFGTNSTGGADLAFSPTGGSTFQPTQAQLAATPGYQFDLSQGLESVQNSAAARGLATSGAALKGAANFATGLANNTLTTQQQIFQQNLQNQQGIFQENLGNMLNPLQSMTQLGENAGALTGQQGTTAAANAGAGLVGAGNAAAAGTVGAANAASGAISSIASSAGSAPINYLLYNNLLSGGNAAGSIPAGGTGMVEGGEGGGAMYGNSV